MGKKLSDKITELVSQGETGKALNLLHDQLAARTPRNETLYRSVVLLLGKYNKFEREQRLGLEPEDKDLNRIEYNLLRITEDLRKGKLSGMSQQTGNVRRVSSTRQSQNKTSTTSPIVWVLATLGGLVVLVFVIAGLTAIEDPEITNFTDDTFDTYEQKFEPQGEIEADKIIENTPTDINPSPTLTDINNQVIRNLLAGSSWLDTTNGNGFINFNASGKSATYLDGAGRIQVEGIRTDGFIYAVYFHPDGTKAYLAISPQMVGNDLSVFVQNPLTSAFLPIPMIWSKQ